MQPCFNRFYISIIAISLVIGMGIFGSHGNLAVKVGSAQVFNFQSF
jgi:hypothetical protein